MSDLFYGDGLPKERWRVYIENREKRKIEAVYNYASINGDYAYTKVRLEGKKMLFGILSNERFAYGLNGKNKKTFNAAYHGKMRIIAEHGAVMMIQHCFR